MKKLVVVFAILVSSLSFAQSRDGKRKNDNLEKKLTEITKNLNLSEKQQIEVKAILEEQSKKRENLRSEMKAYKEKGEKPSDEKRAEMKKAMIDDQLEIKTKMKKILSDEQLKKWQEIRKEKGERTGQKRGKGKKIHETEDKSK